MADFGWGAQSKASQAGNGRETTRPYNSPIPTTAVPDRAPASCRDDPNKRRPDITVAKRVLGWEPKVPVRDGLQKAVEYFRRELEDTGESVCDRVRRRRS